MIFAPIDASSFTPIYAQNIQQIKTKIALGILRPGVLLPSIRDLASDLLINPNTVARAYRELEGEGLITARKGMGCFISEKVESRFRKLNEEVVEEILDRAIGEVNKFAIDSKQLERIFHNRLYRSTQKKKES